METKQTIQVGGDNTSITYQSGSQLDGINWNFIPQELYEIGLVIVVNHHYYGGTVGQSGGASSDDARSSSTESVSDFSKEDGETDSALAKCLKRKRRDIGPNVLRSSARRNCRQKSSDKDWKKQVE